MAERLIVKRKSKPATSVGERVAQERIAEEALTARIDSLWRSGEEDPVSGLPAFLDRKRWHEKH